MEAWKNIINTALLGTAKKQLASEELPAQLTEQAQVISGSLLEPEEKFLQLAALAFNYRQCGSLPVRKENLHVAVAPAEEKPYCTTVALQVLKDILHADNNVLLGLWLEKCEEAQQSVEPEIVPLLFTIAERHKNLQQSIKNCCGRRGEWLCQFNPSWNFTTTGVSEDLWLTGTPDQRKYVLSATRTTEPAKARQWLQQTWDKENANTRADLLKIMHIHLGQEDEEWLHTLLKDKSQKVKDEALDLLKQIPGSSIVKQYEELLVKSLSEKKEKSLLGLISKKKLEISLPADIDPAIFKTGIEKLSSSKEINDEEFIIYQLIQNIPPASLENIFSATPSEIIELLNKDNLGKKLLPAIGRSVARFSDRKWAEAYADTADRFYAEVAALLGATSEEKYLLKHFSHYPEEVIRYATHQKREWGLELTHTLLRYTAKNPYQYNRGFYNNIIHLIPVKAKEEMKRMQSDDTIRHLWEGVREHVENLLLLKEQTIKSFNR